MTTTDEQEVSKYLDAAIENLKTEAVAWHKECEADIAESGHPLGDGKELRRAEEWIRTLFERALAEKQRWQIEARIDELTHVRMGHYAGVTEIFREGKAVTASERLKHLKSLLPSSNNQEKEK